MATKGDRSLLRRDREIGRGGFGVVYYGRYRTTQEVAIKDIPGYLSPDAQHEAQMLKQLHHPNIIRYIDIIFEDNQTSLVMEFIDKGNLYDYIRHTVPSSIYWKTTQDILIHVAHGMSYLHEKSIVHADLKSLNILLRHNYHAVICDFGLAQVQYESTTQYTDQARGTVRWFAPELCTIPPERPSFASDIWAYGCVILEVLSQKVPWMDQFGGNQNQVLVKALGEKKSKKVFEKMCGEQEGPKHVRDVLSRCCSWEKSGRPDFRTIVSALCSRAEEGSVCSDGLAIGPRATKANEPKVRKQRTPRATTSRGSSVAARSTNGRASVPLTFQGLQIQEPTTDVAARRSQVLRSYLEGRKIYRDHQPENSDSRHWQGCFYYSDDE